MSRWIRMRRWCGTLLKPLVMRTSSSPVTGRTTTPPIRAPSRHFCNLTVSAKQASVRFCGTTVLASMASNKLVTSVFFVRKETQMRFENKSVIITGGGGKIGKAYAIGFAREGAKVALSDIASADHVVKAIRDMGGTAISMAC